MLLFLRLFVLFYPICLFAYIPNSLMILDRTTANHGTGVFNIEQEVHFASGPNEFVLKETWLVANGSVMKVTVAGTKEWHDEINFSVLYRGSQRIFFDTTGVKKTVPQKNTFFEKYFYVRDASDLAVFLYTNNIIPAQALKRNQFNQTLLRKPVEIESFIEPFVHLARFGGVVNYAFYTPKAENDNSSKPGLWIEQDQFVIRRLRLRDGTDVRAEKYVNAGNNLFFPKTRTVNWGQNSAAIHLISARPSANRSADLEKIEHIKKTNVNVSNAFEKIEIKDLVNDFYARYR